MSRYKTFVVAIVFATNTVHAARMMDNIQRGGLGFLFPDHNSFINPGQFANSGAIGVQALYQRDTGNPAKQTLLPSIVYGNGTLGLGIYGNRTGVTNNIFSNGTDQVGGGLGVSLIKKRLTLGARYDGTLNSGSSGSGTVTATLNPTSNKGVAIGVSFTNNFSTKINTLLSGIGYTFMSNNSFEFNFLVPDINLFNTYTLSALLNLRKGILYFGGGYQMTRSAASTNAALGRLGFVLGRNVDISALATYVFGATTPLTWGGTFRAAF